MSVVVIESPWLYFFTRRANIMKIDLFIGLLLVLVESSSIRDANLVKRLIKSSSGVIFHNLESHDMTTWKIEPVQVEL